MNILEVCTSRSWGGMEMRTLKTAEWFKKTGHKVTLLCFPGSSLHKHAEEININTTTLPFKNGIHLNLILRLRKLLKQNHFDIIHSQFSKDLRFVVPAVEGLKPKIPIVLTKRLGSYISKKDLLHKYLYSRVDLVTTISKVIKENVIETCPVDSSKVEIIYNGVDIEEFRKAYDKREVIRKEMNVDNEIVIGMFGRFSPGKGHEEFLQAAKKIIEINKNVKFWIVGSPSYEEEEYAEKIHSLAKEFELSDYITFTGFRDDIPELMNAVDIIAVPSHAEAFGNVAIEGMAAGKPIAASNTDGLTDIVIDGETGIQFSPKDSNALANALQKLIDDKELRGKLGKAGLKLVEEHFNEDKQYKKLEQRFIEIIDTTK